MMVSGGECWWNGVVVGVVLAAVAVAVGLLDCWIVVVVVLAAVAVAVVVVAVDFCGFL